MEEALQRLTAELDHEKEKRAADRSGRIRAEQELKKLQLRLLELEQQLASTNPPAQSTDLSHLPRKRPATSDGHDDEVREADACNEDSVKEEEAIGHTVNRSAPGSSQQAPLMAYPLRPIGFVRSCFTQRNGTPRQPQLVPGARCVVDLAPDIPHYCLEGLEQYSHVWLIYVFHENTDLAKSLSADRGKGIKAKIHVPRLNGGKMGVLATRSPHRPAPIGLSVVKVLGVEGRRLILGGADVVNGSPVLDIKPYVPYCDSLTDATAPPWVMADGQDDPLALSGVEISDAVKQQMVKAWMSTKKTSLYSSSDDFVALVKQVLSRDIRSVHQRLHKKPDSQPAGQSGQEASMPPSVSSPSSVSQGAVPTTLQSDTAEAAGGGGGQFHVILDGIDVSYQVDDQGVVHVMDACVWAQK